MDVLYNQGVETAFFENSHRNFMDQSMTGEAQDAAYALRLKDDSEERARESDIDEARDDIFKGLVSSFPDGYFTAAFCVAQLAGKTANECVEFV